MEKQSAEQQYLELLKNIRDQGVEKEIDRTKTGTTEIFGPQISYDIADEFPLLTTKRVALGMVATELCWMISGDSNIQYLVQRNCNIWNEWPFKSYLTKTEQTTPEQGTDEWQDKMTDFVENIKHDDNFAAKYGDLGPVYGYQWRHWPDGSQKGIDQLGVAQRAIRERDSDWGRKMARRIIVNAWNVADLEAMDQSGLPPCHMTFQFHTHPDGKLDMKMYQRSADMFLGVPFNMAQYALLLTMMAETTDTQPGQLIHSFGSAHIYKNHTDQVNQQLSREPRTPPTLRPLSKVTELEHFKPEDIKVDNYQPHPAIKAQVAI